MHTAVSAMITTFNRSAIVGEAIASVFSQTRPVDELILIDDGSSDATEATVAKSFASAPVRCRYIKKPNGGMATSLNRGIAEATGDWIAFLDDDDLWSADHIERCLSIASQRPSWGCVCGLREEKGELQTPPPNYLAAYSEDDVGGRVLKKACEPLRRPFFTPVVGTALIKRAMFEKLLFSTKAGARLDIYFFWCLSQLTTIGLDMRSHGIARQFRVSYLSTDRDAPQEYKDQIALKRNASEIAMLETLLDEVSLPKNHEFGLLLKNARIARPYLLRNMGRYDEALRALRSCANDSHALLAMKELALSLLKISSRSACEQQRCHVCHHPTCRDRRKTFARRPELR